MKHSIGGVALLEESNKGFNPERISTDYDLPNGRRWVRCAVCSYECGKPMPVCEILMEADDFSRKMTYVFRCHGAVERATIDWLDAMNAKHIVIGPAFEDE